MEITDPLRALASGVTSSNSPHNSATSNTHVSVTAGSWIQSPRMIATSCNVIVIYPMGTWNVCLGPPSLDETSDEWPIDHDGAQTVYTIESRVDHVWTNT